MKKIFKEKSSKKQTALPDNVLCYKGIIIKKEGQENSHYIKGKRHPEIDSGRYVVYDKGCISNLWQNSLF